VTDQKKQAGEVEFEGTRLLQLVLHFLRSDKRVLVLQGGTRSGKSYAIAQGLCIEFVTQLAQRGSNETWMLSVFRKRMPSLKGSAMRDFFEILNTHNWYDQAYHNKTESEYKVGPIGIEFLGLDDPQKVRGRKRDLAWMNEANEFTFEDFMQIVLRTSGKVILDYNPSDEYHWIYDKVLIRDDIMFDISTYRDNTFLSEDIIKEIEWLREVDDNAWRIYGMGERGSSGAAIYPRFETCEKLPGVFPPVYGLDFGYNNPSSLVAVEIGTNEDNEPSIWIDLLMYERKLTTADVIKRLGDLLEDPYYPTYADSSSPERIDEIRSHKFNIIPADKRNHSVKDGIDFVKRHKIYITEDSEELIREMRGYKWQQDKDERILDVPVKFRDHALDALRYAAYTHYGRPVQWLIA